MAVIATVKIYKSVIRKVIAIGSVLLKLSLFAKPLSQVQVRKVRQSRTESLECSDWSDRVASANGSESTLYSLSGFVVADAHSKVRTF